MVKLYGHPYSPNSRKVHFAIEECGVTYEYHTVDLTAGAQKQPDFLALNPNGRVPVIDDDGFLLWESNAILWYVADTYGQGKLVPADPKKRALIDQWMWWQYSDLGPACGRPWIMKFYARFGRPLDADQHAKLCEDARTPLALLDASLAGRRWLLGDTFSIADISLSEHAGLCGEAGISLEPYANVRGWLGRVAERPAFQKTRPPRA